jgi:hypothetical protein
VPGRSTRSLERTTMLREAPTQIKRAVFLLWASLGLSVVAAVLEWDPLDPELREIEGVLWGIGIVCILLSGALNYFVSQRRNWARIAVLISTVVVVALMAAFPEEMSGESLPSIVQTVLITAIDLVAVYWLFTGSGGKWFSTKVVA